MGNIQRYNIQEIKSLTRSIFDQHGITKASLFGSYSSGESHLKSDKDIMILPPKSMGLFEFAGLKIELEEKLGKKVDLISSRSIKPAFKDSITNNSQPLIWFTWVRVSYSQNKRTVETHRGNAPIMKAAATLIKTIDETYLPPLKKS